jgi:hypothetical protein
MRRLATCVIAAALTIWGQSASAIELAAHRAEYKLTLSDQHGGGDVSSGSGTMFYEVTDACEGWAVRQRLVMHLVNHDGQDINMISDYTTYETKDGRKLQFRMKQTTDQSVTSEVAGEATIDHPGGPGIVSYTLPEPTTKPLPEGVLFPTAHTVAILEAAESGKKFLALPLFDGTSADGAQDSSIVINGWNQPAKTEFAPLAVLPSGHFHIAFFDREAQAQQPDYEVSMRYWSNGIADGLIMDFGDFAMDGKLDKLTVMKPGC